MQIIQPRPETEAGFYLDTRGRKNGKLSLEWHLEELWSAQPEKTPVAPFAAAHGRLSV